MLIYLFGEPGVGKSTFMTRLIRQYAKGTPDQPTKPFKHTVWPNRVVHLGNPKPNNALHPGTDTLSYGALPVACAWISQQPNAVLILGEGDRLANRRFWDTADASGHLVVPVWLHNPTAAAEGRAMRGTTQDERWIQSRVSRSRNLADYPGVIMVDPRAPDAAETVYMAVNTRMGGRSNA